MRNTKQPNVKFSFNRHSDKEYLELEKRRDFLLRFLPKNYPNETWRQKIGIVAPVVSLSVFMYILYAVIFSGNASDTPNSNLLIAATAISVVIYGTINITRSVFYISIYERVGRVFADEDALNDLINHVILIKKESPTSAEQVMTYLADTQRLRRNISAQEAKYIKEYICACIQQMNDMNALTVEEKLFLEASRN